MRVKQSGKKTELFSSQASLFHKQKTSEKKFIEAISEAFDKEIEEDLDKLIERIDKSAENLVNKRTAAALSEYKQLITTFMQIIIERGMKIKEIPSARFMETNKVFIIASKVENGLLELAEKIKDKNTTALEIASITSDIRGWLFEIRI